ncbi:MAG: hypothetical protein HQ538_00075, partial [Parcubacteria group bacterium]|nr:hypothetical protein [Parcubacteria group bacterium]
IERAEEEKKRNDEELDAAERSKEALEKILEEEREKKFQQRENEINNVTTDTALDLLYVNASCLTVTAYRAYFIDQVRSLIETRSSLLENAGNLSDEEFKSRLQSFSDYFINISKNLEFASKTPEPSTPVPEPVPSAGGAEPSFGDDSELLSPDEQTPDPAFVEEVAERERPPITPDNENEPKETDLEVISRRLDNLLGRIGNLPPDNELDSTREDIEYLLEELENLLALVKKKGGAENISLKVLIEERKTFLRRVREAELDRLEEVIKAAEQKLASKAQSLGQVVRKFFPKKEKQEEDDEEKNEEEADDTDRTPEREIDQKISDYRQAINQGVESLRSRRDLPPPSNMNIKRHGGSLKPEKFGKLAESEKKWFTDFSRLLLYLKEKVENLPEEANKERDQLREELNDFETDYFAFLTKSVTEVVNKDGVESEKIPLTKILDDEEFFVDRSTGLRIPRSHVNTDPRDTVRYRGYHNYYNIFRDRISSLENEVKSVDEHFSQESSGPRMRINLAPSRYKENRDRIRVEKDERWEELISAEVALDHRLEEAKEAYKKMNEILDEQKAQLRFYNDRMETYKQSLEDYNRQKENFDMHRIDVEPTAPEVPIKPDILDRLEESARDLEKAKGIVDSAGEEVPLDSRYVTIPNESLPIKEPIFTGVAKENPNQAERGSFESLIRKSGNIKERIDDLNLDSDSGTEIKEPGLLGRIDTKIKNTKLARRIKDTKLAHKAADLYSDKGKYALKKRFNDWEEKFESFLEQIKRIDEETKATSGIIEKVLSPFSGIKASAGDSLLSANRASRAQDLKGGSIDDKDRILADEEEQLKKKERAESKESNVKMDRLNLQDRRLLATDTSDPANADQFGDAEKHKNLNQMHDDLFAELGEIEKDLKKAEKKEEKKKKEKLQRTLEAAEEVDKEPKKISPRMRINLLPGSRAKDKQGLANRLENLPAQNRAKQRKKAYDIIKSTGIDERLAEDKEIKRLRTEQVDSEIQAITSDMLYLNVDDIDKIFEVLSSTFSSRDLSSLRKDFTKSLGARNKMLAEGLDIDDKTVRKFILDLQRFLQGNDLTIEDLLLQHGSLNKSIRGMSKGRRNLIRKNR